MKVNPLVEKMLADQREAAEAEAKAAAAAKAAKAKAPASTPARARRARKSNFKPTEAQKEAYGL